MNAPTSIPSLIEAVGKLRAEMLHEEEAIGSQIAAICETHRDGARNLAHYIALRRHDIRDLQEQLSGVGLSSLGRIEADVLALWTLSLRSFIFWRELSKAEWEAEVLRAGTCLRAIRIRSSDGPRSPMQPRGARRVRDA